MNSGDYVVYDVIIIGAGASGMMCGSFLKYKKNDLKILVLEKNDKVGKKLSMTGNGKCNIGNTNLNITKFHSNSDLKRFRKGIESNDYIPFLEKIGILTTTEDERIYPYSMQAIGVCKSFERYLVSNGVQIKYNYKVTKIDKICDEFIINDEIKCKKLVVATGGITYPKTGSTGDGYNLLKVLGHTITDIYPSLTYLVTNYKYQKELQGVRVNALATLVVDNKVIKTEKGQVQFTKNALSGICIFNLSRNVKKYLNNNQSVLVSLDLIPEYKSLKEYFKQFQSYKIQDALSCVINNKIAIAICKELKVYDMLLSDIDDDKYNMIVSKLKKMKFNIIDVGDELVAQVSNGGVSLDELNDYLQSKIINSLYVIGELVDVDGDCGGYNLSWAFNSAILASLSILDRLV